MKYLFFVLIFVGILYIRRLQKAQRRQRQVAKIKKIEEGEISVYKYKENIPKIKVEAEKVDFIEIEKDNG